MLFINTTENALRFQICPGGEIYNVEPIGEVDIPDRYAYAVKLHGLPLEPVTAKPKEDPKNEAKPAPAKK